MAENKTVAELRAEAREKGLHGYSTMKKAELISALTNPDDAPVAEPAEPAEPTTPAPVAPPAQAEPVAITAAPTRDALSPAPTREAIAPPRKRPAITHAPAPRDAVAEADASRAKFVELRHNSPTPLPGDRVSPGMIAAIAAVLAILIVIIRRRRS